MSWKKTSQTVALSLLVLLGLPAAASASCLPTAQTCSSNYSVGETYFSSGGNLSACSSSYCAKQTAGQTASGNTAGTTYKAQAGIATADPYIQLLVGSTNVDLGTMQSGTSYTTTASFSVKTYLASGYIVQTMSPGPTTPGHTLNPLSSPTASSPSTEQFGINLVANSSCAGVNNGNGGTIAGSAGPAQNPTGFGFGVVAAGYNTACSFKYVNGDTIASSPSTSGETDYVISYLFNIAPNTPSGLYAFNQTLVATSTY